MEDIKVIKEIFTQNLTSFDILKIDTLESGDIDICVRKRQSLAEYCRNRFPYSSEIKSGDQVYNVAKFYINIGEGIKVVFVIRKDYEILNVFSLYECKHPDLFSNEILNMKIDEIIKEDELS